MRCFACAVSCATRLLFTGVPARCVACVCGVLGHLAPVHLCARSACCVACAVSWATWPLFTGVPAWCVVLLVRCPGPLGSCSPVCPLGALPACAVSPATWLLVTDVPFWCVVLLVRCPGPLGSCSTVCPLGALPACAVSLATWLLFTGVLAWCVVLLVRCPGPLGSRSPVCPLGALLCLLGVLGHLAPVHRCARSVRSFACAVSLATWPLFTGVPAWCVVLLVRCPGPLGSSSPVCLLGPLLCLCGVLGNLAPVHLCARSVCCLACAVSWATGLLFTGVPARCVACVCDVLGHLAPVQGCGRLVRCFACAVSWATWLLSNGVPARRVVLRVRCPGPLGPRSPVCPLGVLCCVSGVVGDLAPVHRCARSMCSVACAVSWATRLLFTDVPARRVVLCVQCPGPLGSCSPVCPLGVQCGVCGVPGILAPVHQCARSACCLACAVSSATWLLFTGVPAWRVVLCVRCPGPLGSCSPVCPLGALPACAVSWATWLLFTCVPARRVVLRVRCPGPPGLCSPVCPLGALFCLCGVLGHLAPVHLCARSACCVACAVSWATWPLFTDVPFWCVVLLVRCPGPLGSVSAASPICSDFQTFCPDWLHFGHFLCFGGIAASQLSLRIFPIYF